MGKPLTFDLFPSEFLTWWPWWHREKNIFFSLFYASLILHEAKFADFFFPVIRREKLSPHFFLCWVDFFLFQVHITQRTRCQQQRRRTTKLDPSWGVPAGWPAPLPAPTSPEGTPKTRWPLRVWYFFHALFLNSRKWIIYFFLPSPLLMLKCSISLTKVIFR